MTNTGITTRAITFGNTAVKVTLPAGTVVEFHADAITARGLVYARVAGRRLAEVIPASLIVCP